MDQKALSAKLLMVLTEEAIDQVKEIRERRLNRTEKPEYRQRAKEAIAVVGTCVNMHATLSRDRTNDIVQGRMLEKAPKVLSAVPDGE